MNKSNYESIGIIAAILGAVFILVGLYAATFNYFMIGGFGHSGYVYPYIQYAPGLIMCGITSEIISVLMLRASKARPTESIGIIAAILGVAFLLVGFWAATFANIGGGGLENPYIQYAPLMILGVVLLVVGVFMLRASKATPTPA